MATLIMAMGLPGSGKSTWAKSKIHSIRVNKDDIRASLHKPWSYEVEKEVVQIRDQMIKEVLLAGKDVISDDTNLAPKHEARLRQIAKECGAGFDVNDTFLWVPIETCVTRDAQREGVARVGEKVIRDMAEQFLDVSNWVPRTAVAGKPQLFLDLDGVLADFDGLIERECGIVNNRENEDPDFWDKARAYKGRLYYDMDLMPGAKDLWSRLKGFRPIILTGVPWSIPTAADDKRQWVREKIDPDVFVLCCRSRSKSKYAKVGDILVDDWPKYKALWETKGVFVHYTGDNDKTVEEVRNLLGRE